MKRGESLPAHINGTVFATAPVAQNNPRPPRTGGHAARRKPELNIVHATPGRLRARVNKLDATSAVKIRAAMMAVSGVHSAILNPRTGSVIVCFETPTTAGRIISRLRAVLNGNSTGEPQRSRHAEIQWHALSRTEIAARLRSSLTRGLTPAVVQQRIQKYGRNVIPKPQQRSDLNILAAQFKSLPVALLFGAGTLSIVTGALLEAGAVFAVIAANGAIGFITERQAERSIANLGIGGPRSCHVLRAGASQEVDVDSLVPGDVLELHGGMAIPADARLLSSEALTISEAALTGESVPVHKSASAVVAPNAALGDRRNMVYRGTIVTGGAGTAMVMATGGKTELGAIQRLVGSTATPQTPMQRELAQLGGQLGWLTLAATGVMGGVGLLRRAGILDTARSSLALAVAAVPEGLPMVATTTLAFGAEALRRRGVLVRQMNAIEALASGQVICFDKTGTLTLNRMSLTQIASGDQVWRLLGDQLLGEKPDLAMRDARLRALLRAACLCNDTVVERQNGQILFNGS